MREIRDKVTIEGTKGKKEVQALFDTGSYYGYVSKNIADEIGLLVFDKPRDVSLPDKRKMEMKPAIGILEVKGCRMPILTLIAENGLSEMVLGMFHMEAMGIKIDSRKGYTVSCPVPRA